MSVFPVSIPVTYFKEWNDGFGARGWKVDSSTDDPAVIAATAETGDRIPTSVLIHDMLDHYLCGLEMSGHRNEACALIQLASRTQSDPTPDFTQMVEEDLLNGLVNGESFAAFAGDELTQHTPANLNTDKDMLTFLRETIGDTGLKRALIQRFFDIGYAYQHSARTTYENHGLDYERRKELGLRLQRLLAQADRDAVEEKWTTCRAVFEFSDDVACLKLVAPIHRYYE